MKTKLTTLKAVREALAEKSKQGHQVFEQAGADLDFGKVTVFGESLDTTMKVEKVQALQTELTDLKADYDELMAISDKANETKRLNEYLNMPAHQVLQPDPANGGGLLPVTKTLGQRVMEKKDWRANGPGLEMADIDVKTLFETGAGWAPESIRQPGFVGAPAREIVIVDYIPQFPTSQSSVIYMLETTATYNADEKAEGAAYAESAFALTATTEPVCKVTTSLPVTDEQLEDVAFAEAYINQRLVYDLRQKLDSQVLVGAGGGTDIKGTTQIGGSLQTQALGSDPIPDAIYKAFDLVRTVGFAEPSVLFINPADWQPVRLLRTADGIYIFGNPMDAAPLRIWGVPVVSSMAVTANTGITGDYNRYSYLAIRKGVNVAMGYVADNFKEGKKTFRADIRCAMVHTRTAAFCTITGI